MALHCIFSDIPPPNIRVWYAMTYQRILWMSMVFNAWDNLHPNFWDDVWSTISRITLLMQEIQHQWTGSWPGSLSHHLQRSFLLRLHSQGAFVGFLNHHLYLHPGRLTWNLQITHLERKMIFQTSRELCSMLIFQGVNLTTRLTVLGTSSASNVGTFSAMRWSKTFRTWCL